jgi:putative lipoic acid-binding regulatory protein
MASSNDDSNARGGTGAGEAVAPLVEYPTDYAFKIIGRSGPDFSTWARGLVAGALGIDISPAAVREKPSSKGKYLSVEVTVRLESEAQRRAVYDRLHQESDIVFYL